MLSRVEAGPRTEVALWLVVIGLTSGCQTGIMTDRNVRVSQHIGGEADSVSPPATRLAPAGMAAGVSTTPDRHDDPAVASHGPQRGAPALANTSQLDQPTTTVARVAHREPVAESRNGVAQSAPQANGVSMQLGDLGDEDEEDVAALMAVFRDSPPEVQSQALRQLVAALTHRAGRTNQPGNIQSRLVESVEHLPELTDEYEDTGLTPTRLASSQPSGQANSAASPSPPIAAETRRNPSAATLDPAIEAAAAVEPQQAGGAQVAAFDSDGQERIGANQAGIDPRTTGNGQPSPATVPVAPLSEDELYAELIQRMSEPRLGESDGDRFRRLLAIRHLQVLAGDPDSAVSEIPGLKPYEQEFLRNHLLALWNMTDPNGHPVAGRRLSTALPRVRDATRNLAAASEHLEIGSLAFCTEIISFGQVKHFPSNRFEAGQRVILYCEIDNFLAEKVPGGFETELQGSYEVFAADGTKIAGQVLPTDQQVSSHYLRDYFIAYQMHLPPQLSAGEYRLELTMECVRGRKYGQASVGFVIK